jgi:hypothetical protein
MPFLFEADIGDDPVGPFTTLMHRLLRPVRCGFTLMPRPSPHGGRGHGRFIGTPPAVPVAWQGRFAAVLADLLGKPQTVVIRLTLRHALVGVGQFASTSLGLAPGGSVDVADLVRMPDRIAAGAVAHELTEQWQRQGQGVGDFLTAHRVALGAEARVTGAPRVQEFMTPTPPGGRSLEASWQWWIGLDSGGGTVAALAMQMRGWNITASRLLDPPYATAAAFAAAARAAGLEPQD